MGGGGGQDTTNGGVKDMSKSEKDPTTPLEIDEKLKYPKSVFFIISNEFCERFSYYGMRAVLALYLQKLGFGENNATLLYHLFVMLCYFTPLIGAIIADSYLGKFKTIFYISLIYVTGNIVLSVGSISALNINHIGACVAGLILIGLGTGGIKPCVSAFGGDQFVLPQQEKLLAQFFSIFYFSINAGSVLSSFLTPLLRERVQCFGEDTCYPLAFGVPAILMVLALVIFMVGKPSYKIKKPQKENVVVEIFSCCTHAVARKTRIQKLEKKEHWLEYADDKYSAKLIADTKIVLGIIYLLAPTVVFWALFEQQGSRWTFQASHMNGDLGFYVIQPDQMQTINPILILALIPVFQSFVYPLLAKLRIMRTPLQKLSYGGLLAALSFLISGFLQMKIEAQEPILPTNGTAYLRLYNVYDFELTIESSHFNSMQLPPYSSINIDNLPVKNLTEIQLKIRDDRHPGTIIGTVELDNRMISSYMIFKGENALEIQKLSIAKAEEIEKSKRAHAKVRAIYTGSEIPKIELESSLNKILLNSSKYQTDIAEVKSYQSYNVIINGNKSDSSYYLQPGGVFTIIVKSPNETTLLTITEPNSVSLLWQIPQYVIITCAEIMFSITGLEFCYSQSPLSMKSVISSLWLITNALGNVIILIIAGMRLFDSQASEFFLFAGFMTFIMGIFILIAMNYKYAEIPTEEGSKERNGRQENGTS